MDAMTLLAKAQGAGLAVRVEGEKLVVRGPRKAEKLAHKLLDCKAKLMPLLTQPQTAEVGGETPPTWAVRVWSDLLQESLWVVVDKEPSAALPSEHVKKLESVKPGAVGWVPLTAGAKR
jgi:hypothetical protein